jgi:hypothetical protein
MNSRYLTQIVAGGLSLFAGCNTGSNLTNRSVEYSEKESSISKQDINGEWESVSNFLSNYEPWVDLRESVNKYSENIRFIENESNLTLIANGEITGPEKKSIKFIGNGFFKVVDSFERAYMPDKNTLLWLNDGDFSDGTTYVRNGSNVTSEGHETIHGKWNSEINLRSTKSTINYQIEIFPKRMTFSRNSSTIEGEITDSICLGGVYVLKHEKEKEKFPSFSTFIPLPNNQIVFGHRARLLSEFNKIKDE